MSGAPMRFLAEGCSDLYLFSRDNRLISVLVAFITTASLFFMSLLYPADCRDVEQILNELGNLNHRNIQFFLSTWEFLHGCCVFPDCF